MSLDEHILEIKGEDVEQAIQDGLNQLNLSREEVSIEILDEGSSGFLGIGGRNALVRLTVSGSAQAAASVAESAVVEASPPVEEAADDPGPDDAESAEMADEKQEDLDADYQREAEVAQEIVSNLLRMMEVEATIDHHQTEPDDLTGERRWVIDIRGEDMGVLIGPRGETLNSLQYITRLMAGHTMRRRTSFIIDVEGYRERREQALARLAERMAEKALRRGQPLTLEPMPPNERRIIHITLRDNDQVYTESVGVGRERKVRIYLQ
jgi:spoIIIJ-associated protein